MSLPTLATLGLPITGAASRSVPRAGEFAADLLGDVGRDGRAVDQDPRRRLASGEPAVAEDRVDQVLRGADGGEHDVPGAEFRGEETTLAPSAASGSHLARVRL